MGFERCGLVARRVVGQGGGLSFGHLYSLSYTYIRLLLRDFQYFILFLSSSLGDSIITLYIFSMRRWFD